MLKYAFIMNSRGLTPETYSVTFSNDAFYYYIAAVHGMKMTREIVKKLAAEGFNLVNLCGDYNAEKAEDVRSATDHKIEVRYAKYSEEDLQKLDTMESLNEYGIIFMEDGIGDKAEKFRLETEEYNTSITFANSNEMAVEAAKEMVEQGVLFIELCSYFDLKKADEIAEAIGHKVPIGYCG